MSSSTLWQMGIGQGPKAPVFGKKKRRKKPEPAFCDAVAKLHEAGITHTSLASQGVTVWRIKPQGKDVKVIAQTQGKGTPGRKQLARLLGPALSALGKVQLKIQSIKGGCCGKDCKGCIAGNKNRQAVFWKASEGDSKK